MPRKSALPADRDVGQRVRVRRLELGLSQQRLGQELGLTFQQVQKYEKGTNRIGAGRLQQIAKILKVPTSYFFDDAPDGLHSPNVLQFLDTAYALRLVRAFSRLSDRRQQLRIVELVEHLADPAPPRER
jgi:transcriptional regulator with XRE-family HTH domain